MQQFAGDVPVMFVVRQITDKGIIAHELECRVAPDGRALVKDPNDPALDWGELVRGNIQLVLQTLSPIDSCRSYNTIATRTTQCVIVSSEAPRPFDAQCDTASHGVAFLPGDD